MPGRIYLVKSTGGNVLASTGDRVYWRDLLPRYAALSSPLRARAARYVALEAALSGRLARVAELSSGLHAFAKSGYEIWARNLADDTETLLGFIAGGGTALNGVALADGEYEIEVRLSGYYWRELRQAARFRLKVAGGVAAANLPAVTGLGYAYNLAGTQLSWYWASQAGAEAPADFAVWTGAADPVDTSGAPAYTLAAVSTGPYSLAVAQGAAALYAAVCARDGAGGKGPVAKLAIPAPPGAVASPDGQLADFR